LQEQSNGVCGDVSTLKWWHGYDEPDLGGQMLNGTVEQSDGPCESSISIYIEFV
jgi:hypothetical protein